MFLPLLFVSYLISILTVSKASSIFFRLVASHSEGKQNKRSDKLTMQSCCISTAVCCQTMGSQYGLFYLSLGDRLQKQKHFQVISRCELISVCALTIVLTVTETKKKGSQRKCESSRGGQSDDMFVSLSHWYVPLMTQ